MDCVEDLSDLGFAEIIARELCDLADATQRL